MGQKEKTRNLSLISYLEALQREYMIAELRRKIYQKIKDKKFYEKVMSHKRRKIEDISLRNSLPNIFDNDSEKERFRAQIYGEGGFPNFIYRDEEEREELESKDYQYYYSEEAEVRVESEEDEILIGTIFCVFENTVHIKVRGEEKISIHPKERVTRIL